jgi:hypothetical protein
MPHSRRKFFRTIFYGGFGSSIAGLTYARELEPERVQVCDVPLTLPRLASSFDGYRVAQISDIHMDHWMTQSRLARIVEQVNTQKADLIALTGDFITRDVRRYVDHLVPALHPLSAPDGVVAILGNHDYWSGAKEVRQVIRRCGMKELKNEILTLRRGKDQFHIAGVDDVWAGKPDLDGVLGKLPKDGAAMLLAHEPDFADVSAKTGRFDLQISGHSHGGQVRLPGYGALRLPYWGRKYPCGLYRIGEMQLYTNRGLGMVGPHIRFNCRPEITIFTLHSKA